MSHPSICRAPHDETQPCPFVSICKEPRQRMAAGYHFFGGGTYSKVPMSPPVRGTACCWYQQGAEKRRDLLPRVEADVKREAIQAEGL